ncbi:MAG: DUF1295 domain-containing protein [Nannocystaceae bacterium]|nr:DUF1295 domain-containing protein [Nannocystaceae bacterium]
MSELDIHRMILLAVFVAAGATFAATGLKTVPYGRHRSGGDGGFGIPERLGWVVMEAPCVFGFWWIFQQGGNKGELVPMVFLCMWMTHYVHRGIIYPLRKRVAAGKTLPLLMVVVPGFIFNSANAYLNARWISALGPAYPIAWLWSFRFLYGALLFVTGFVINRWADYKLRTLRAPGETGYRIPRGGLYDEVSCPNYMGELLQWIGFAIATWSLSGAVFAVFTAANLVPRAVSHHLWYQRQFPNYPRRRRAIIPYLL